jgi:hypothetical protein
MRGGMIYFSSFRAGNGAFRVKKSHEAWEKLREIWVTVVDRHG